MCKITHTYPSLVSNLSDILSDLLSQSSSSDLISQSSSSDLFTSSSLEETNDILYKELPIIEELMFYKNYHLDIENYIASLSRDCRGDASDRDFAINRINKRINSETFPLTSPLTSPEKRPMDFVSDTRKGINKYMYKLGREVYRCQERFLSGFWINDMIPFLDMLDRVGEVNLAMAIAVQQNMGHCWEDIENYDEDLCDMDFVKEKLFDYPNIQKYFDLIREWVAENEKLKMQQMNRETKS